MAPWRQTKKPQLKHFRSPRLLSERASGDSYLCKHRRSSVKYCFRLPEPGFCCLCSSWQSGRTPSEATRRRQLSIVNTFEILLLASAPQFKRKGSQLEARLCFLGLDRFTYQHLGRRGVAGGFPDRGPFAVERG